ncbi:MAG: protein-disulfide reductase DsbD domain-containing protein [Pseudomonadota bacterium]
MSWGLERADGQGRECFKARPKLPRSKPTRLALIATLAAGIAGCMGAAHAGQPTPPFSSAALIAAGPVADAHVAATATGKDTQGSGAPLWAGIRIDLKDGWKTYWRNPGNAGIAASFDWSGSINLRSASIVWPAPDLFFDGYAHSIGYHSPGVVLPVRIVPENPERPVALALRLDYAVCKDICVPERAELAGFVRSAPGAADEVRAINAALAQVPKTASEMPSAVLTPDGAVDVRFAGETVDHVFAVQIDGRPLLVPEAADDPSRYRLSLMGVPDDDRKAGLPIHLTWITPGAAYEAVVRLTTAR